MTVNNGHVSNVELTTPLNMETQNALFALLMLVMMSKDYYVRDAWSGSTVTVLEFQVRTMRSLFIAMKIGFVLAARSFALTI